MLGVFGCAAPTTTTTQDLTVYDAFAVREEGQHSQLLGITEDAYDILMQGAVGTIFHNTASQWVFSINGDHLIRTHLTSGEEQVLRTMPFPSLEINKIAIRTDEEWYALLLRSATPIYDTMVPCGQAQYCTLEVGNLRTGETQLRPIPSSASYTFGMQWPPTEPAPYLVMDRDGTGTEMMYANLDNEGSGFFAFVVRQQGDTPPVVDVLSNDLRIDTIRLETVVEDAGAAYLIFSLRGTERIYHSFPKDYIVAANKLAILPSPTLEHMAIQLGEDMYLFRIRDHNLTHIGKGTRLLGWNTEQELIFTNYSNEYFYTLQTTELADLSSRETCAQFGDIRRKYYPHGERVIVTPANTKESHFIDGKRFQSVFCR